MSKGNKKVLTFVVTILMISIGMSFFIFSTDVQAAIFGTKNYYLALEKYNFNKLEKAFKDSRLKELSCAYKINAKLDGDLMQSDPIMKEIADYLPKFELDINYNANSRDLKDVFYKSLISTKYDGKKLVDIDIKSADDKTLIAFPNLTDKTIGIETSNISSKFNQAFLGDDQAFEEVFGLSREAYDKMVERYFKDVIVNAIPDENVVFNNNADFENIKCNSITFNIDKTALSAIYKALASEIVNDKELKALVTSVTYSFLDTANVEALLINKPSETEIADGIKDFCDELNNAAEDMEEVQFSYTAYIKNNGTIISRQFKDKLGDAGVNLSAYRSLEGIDIFKLNFEESGKTNFELKTESKLHSGSTYNGKLNLDITDKPLLEAKYTYDKGVKSGNLDAFVGKLDGKINLEQFSDDYSAKEMSDIYFSFVNTKENNDSLKGETKITSKVDGKSVGLTIFTEVKQSSVANISKPNVSIDKSIKLTDYTELNEMKTELSASLQKKFLELFPMLDLENDSLLFDNDELYDDEFID